MKTIQQWLSELESPYREQALENISKHKIKYKVKTIHAAIDEFSWIDSPQGYQYWNNLYKGLAVKKTDIDYD